jgi:cell division protein FtsN
MVKDYKDPPARAESRLSHPLLLGMIIGMLLGIVISLAVALWLNRLSNPFVEKARPVEPLPKVGPAPADATRTPEKAAKALPDKPAEADKPARTAERPRFEFYQILPGDKSAGERDAKGAKAPVAPPPVVAAIPAAPRPGSSPASPKPHSGESYWLQAGAFSDEKEADNLKARIALSGLEAAVRPVDVPDKGKIYRVRLGPYQSMDDATRIKAALAQNGVAVNMIRTTEEAKTP